MARVGGNPDFGTKYKFNFGRDVPLTEQIKAVVYPETKEALKKLALDRKCTVPDLVREALEQYLAREQERNVS
jgi:Ribbon-helix-helix protein, copG family